MTKGYNNSPNKILFRNSMQEVSSSHTIDYILHVIYIIVDFQSSEVVVMGNVNREINLFDISFGKAFHVLVDLITYGSWCITVLHFFIWNPTQLSSTDLVSLT